MSGRFSHSRHSQRDRRSRAWPWFFLLVIGIIAGSYPGVFRAPAKRAQPAAAKTASPVTETVRRVYPYSVIPGGVNTGAAFGAYRISDRVLRDHFRDMGSKVIPTTLARDKWMYASYRVANAIYWTKNRVLVRAGERLLTDGNTLVRARCGNRLSDLPQRPMQRFQPPAVTTDTFTTEITALPPPGLIPESLPPEIPLPGLPIVAPPDVAPPVPVEAPYPPGVPPGVPPDTPGEILLPPPVVPVSGPLPPGRPYTPPPYTPPATAPVIPTPEMNTWVLMIGGILCLGLARGSQIYRIVGRDAKSRNARGGPDRAADRAGIPGSG
jgi:hypothetical protein